MADTIRVKGLREVDRAFRQTEKESSKALRAGLVEAARPVAETAQSLISAYAGASVSTIRPRAAAKGAYVTQGAKKKSGLRGDFGSLQMRRLWDALDQNRGAVLEKVERVLADLEHRNGF